MRSGRPEAVALQQMGTGAPQGRSPRKLQPNPCWLITRAPSQRREAHESPAENAINRFVQDALRS